MIHADGIGFPGMLTGSGYHNYVTRHREAVATIGGLDICFKRSTSYSSEPDQFVWYLSAAPEIHSVQTLLNGYLPSAQGTLQMLENLPGRLEKHLQEQHLALADARHTIDQAGKLIGTPFRYESGLAAARRTWQDVQDRITAKADQTTIENPPPPDPAPVEQTLPITVADWRREPDLPPLTPTDYYNPESPSPGHGLDLG